MEDYQFAEGPWIAEPDKVSWIDKATGFECRIERNHLDVLCVGFDCAHLGDLIPGIPLSLGGGRGTYRDLAYVRAEVMCLALQLAEVSPSARKG